MSFFSPGSVNRNDYDQVVITSPLSISRAITIVTQPLLFILSTVSLLTIDPVTEFTATLIAMLLAMTAVTSSAVWRNTTWGETVISNGHVTVLQKRLFVADRIFQIRASDIVNVERVIRHGRPFGWYRQIMISTGGSIVRATGLLSKRAAINAEGALRSAVVTAHGAHTAPEREVTHF